MSSPGSDVSHTGAVLAPVGHGVTASHWHAGEPDSIVVEASVTVAVGLAGKVVETTGKEPQLQAGAAGQVKNGKKAGKNPIIGVVLAVLGPLDTGKFIPEEKQEDYIACPSFVLYNSNVDNYLGLVAAGRIDNLQKTDKQPVNKPKDELGSFRPSLKSSKLSSRPKKYQKNIYTKIISFSLASLCSVIRSSAGQVTKLTVPV